MGLEAFQRDMIEPTMAMMRMHAAWGAPILFGIMVLEGIVLTTFIFSGSVMILAAGALIQAGVLNFSAVFVAASLGFWIGDWINFEFGRRGESWFRGLAIVRNRPEMLAKAEQLIARWGVMAIVISRFAGPSRPFVTFLAGACHMRPLQFHVATVLATLVLTAGLLNAGMTGVQLWNAGR